MALALTCSGFLFAPQKVDVLAKADYSKDQTDTKTIQNGFTSSSNVYEYALYGNQTDNNNCYSIKVTDNRISVSGKPTITITNNAISINSSTTMVNSVDNEINTTLNISDEMYNLKSYYSANFSLNVCSDNGNNHTITFTWGSFSKEITSNTKGGKIESFDIDLNKVNSKTITLKVHSEGSGMSNVLHIEDPKITFTKQDTSAPTIDTTKLFNQISSWDWSGENHRQVSFDVKDMESGIKSVKVINQNGENVDLTQTNSSSDTKSKSFSFDAKYGESYKAVVCDNVNNAGTIDLLSSDDLKLDNTIGDLSINQIDTLHQSKLNVKFNYLSDGKSNEKLYYTLISENDTESIPSKSNFSGIIDADMLGSECQINFDKIISNPIDNTWYIISAIVIDEVGNQSNVFTQRFKYDSRRFAVSVEVEGIGLTDENTNVTYAGTEKLEELGEVVPYAWAGSSVEFGYSVVDGYEFYELRRFEIAKDSKGELLVDENGKFVRIENTEVLISNNDTPISDYKFTCDNNFVFVAKFRYKVNLSKTDKEYVYNADKNGDALSQEFEYTLNTLLDGTEIDKNIINFEYFVNSNTTSGLSNAGTYLINWSVNNSDFVGSGVETVTISPKSVTLSYEDTYAVYSGLTQNISVLCDDQSLNDNEKARLSFVVKYYLVQDLENEIESVINAGNYVAMVSLNNSNYVITNSVVDFEVSKKIIQVTMVSKSEFDYNGNIQNIEYTLSENVSSIVNYYKVIDSVKTLVNFENAGEYYYEILPEDTLNYVFENNEGQCKVNKVAVTFELTKTTYDYTGTELTKKDIQFLSKNAQGEIVNVLGLYLKSYTLVGDQLIETSLFDENTYTIEFDTTNENYILNSITFEIKIVRTKIVVSVQTKYEYSGSNTHFVYEFKNENNEILTNINGITPKIYFGENEIGLEDIKSVGTYTFEFIKSDPKFVVECEYNSFEVIKAQVNIVFKSLSLEYDNEYGYDVEYEIKSKLGTNFNDLFILKFLRENTDEVVDLKDIGTYDFIFDYVNILDKSGIEIVGIFENELSETPLAQNKLQIIERKINVLVQNEYTYSGEILSFNYSIDGKDYGILAEDIKITCENLIDANNYYYTIISTNSNYVINVTNALKDDRGTYVVVSPAQVSIIEMTNNYTYTGQNVSVFVALSKEDLEFSVVATKDDVTTDIKDAGEYKVSLISSDKNYTINCDNLIIIVNPKVVEISVDVESLLQVYDKSIKAISYKILDNDTEIETDSIITYYLNDVEVQPVGANQYDYTITITNPNYQGRYSSSVDTRLVVSKKTLNLIVTPGQFKNYGDIEPLGFDYTLNGLCGDENQDEVVINLQRELGESVGKYLINLVEFEDDNYLIDYVPEYFKINPKKLLIMAENVAKTYGDVDPEFTYKMYLNNRLVTSLIGQDKLEGNLQRAQGENVGEYAITLGTLQSPNYSIIFASGSLKITPRTLNIFIDNKSVEYGQSESLTYSVQGEFDASQIFGELQREAGENVGVYEIHKGTLSSQNYELSVTNGTYTITPKQIVVTALVSFKVYGEQDDLKYDVIGLLGSDALSGELQREAGENVGIYSINKGTLNNDNYSIEFNPNTLTISKANLSIEIDDKTAVYGGEAQKLTCTISGLKFDDTLDITLSRVGGDNAGIYKIIGDFQIPENYALTSYKTGTYTIQKAKITPVLTPKTYVYNGKNFEMTCDNIDLQLRYVYKQFGVVVDSVKNAGTYKVQAFFDGNENYMSAVSNETDLIIEQQLVFFTLTQTEFIYDGNVKYPVFTFDRTLGITEHQIEFTFENNIEPIEIGSYNFEMKVKDGLNFKGTTQGTVIIQKSFEVKNDSGIIECSEATFDEDAKDIKLVQNTETKKFNNEKVLSVCTLENVEAVKNSNYIYTVKVKATQGVDTVKVYKVGLSGFSEIAIKIENGYYVFQVDDLNDKYIITTEIKTLSTLAWIVILVVVALSFSITLIVVAKKKHKKAKVKASKVSDKDIETYNVN